MSRLQTNIGRIRLKNPIICGSGEHTMNEAGIRAALASGAGAVVAKSTNESAAAKSQLDKTDYRVMDDAHRVLPWDFNVPREATLFCRSGLVQQDFEPWVKHLLSLDKLAEASDSYVIPSLILSGLDQCTAYAQQIEKMGFRILEVNIGAPHGDEAAKGAIVLERDAGRIETIVSQLRDAVKMPLWIKLTGQSEDPASLAAAAQKSGADAVVLMGRFMGFMPDLETEEPLLNTSAAIGGGWALPLTARCIALTRKRLGKDFPLLATNGARSGLDVARFLLSGAAATEITSLVMMRGYGALTEAIDELEAYLVRRDKTVSELLGASADRLQSYAEQPDRAGFWNQFAPPTSPSTGNALA